MMKQTTIAEPDWLEGGLESMESTIRLVRSGKMPKRLLGWMLVTSCMRLLRAIYGSDELTIQGLKLRIQERDQAMEKYACSPGIDMR